MAIQALFGLSILMSFVAFGLVTKLYTWPRLRVLERDDALVPLVVPHAFRFTGCRGGVGHMANMADPTRCNAMVLGLLADK